MTGNDCKNAVSAALSHAKSTSNRVCVLQILTSDLYHYGHHDLVATRPSKREFLLYIRDEVIGRGKAEAQALKDAAGAMGVALEINTVESEDILATALAEAKKGYSTIFLPKPEKRFFPLFRKNLADHIQKKVPSRIVPC